MEVVAPDRCLGTKVSMLERWLHSKGLLLRILKQMWKSPLKMITWIDCSIAECKSRRHGFEGPFSTDKLYVLSEYLYLFIYKNTIHVILKVYVTHI